MCVFFLFILSFIKWNFGKVSIKEYLDIFCRVFMIKKQPSSEGIERQTGVIRPGAEMLH